MRFHGLRNLAVAALATALTVTGAVSVVSAHNGSVFLGVVHSCLNGSTGEVRIVKATDDCAKLNASSKDDDKDKKGKDDDKKKVKAAEQLAGDDKDKGKGDDKKGKDDDDKSTSKNWAPFDWQSGGSGGSVTLTRTVVTATLPVSSADILGIGGAGDFTALVSCPSGKIATGGGGGFGNGSVNWNLVHFVNSVPTANGWSVTVNFGDPEGAIAIQVYAVCVSA